MEIAEAVALIRGAVPRRGGTWADLGAGRGVFTRALAERIGPGGRIYAVDRDARAVGALERGAATSEVEVVAVRADFTGPFDLPGVGLLDGMMLANALHFVPEPETVLARLAARLRPGGRLVLVEYDRRGPNRWVPHPIPASRLPALAAAAGLSEPVVTGRRPSAFGGHLYAAFAERPARRPHRG